MNDRQKAYDLKLEEMRKELEGAQEAASKRVEDAHAKCNHEIAKYKVSIKISE